MDTNPEKVLTLRDLLLIYRRRQRLVYFAVASLGILAAIYCAICTRRYEATGIVQVQKESADGMGLESLMSSAAGGASDALAANIELQTQANILQSDSLALRTIEALQMENTQDFRPRWSPIGWVFGFFSPKGVPDLPSAMLEDAPQRRQHAIKVFSRNLRVKPVSGTRLIEIDYTNPDPKLAAAVVNTLTKSLSDYTFQTRYDAANQASQWLSDQLSDLRKDSEKLQEKVVNLQRESGVYSLGTTDSQGREQAYSGVLDKLQQSTLAMTAAEQNRILKGAIAKAADHGDAEMLSGLAGNAASGAGSSSMNNALTLIQNLRQQEATQEAALQEAQAKFGSSYPKLDELRANLAGLDHSIHEEVARIKGRANSDYSIAQQSEASTRLQYNEAKKEADILNDKAIEFAIVRQEAEQSRTLYEDLLKRLKEAGVLEGLRSSNITVVDPGRIPAKPKKPNVPFYMAAAMFSGWLMGCCGALLADTLDNKINTVSDLEEMFAESTLGVLPLVGPRNDEGTSNRNFLALKDPGSIYVEALRSIRSTLMLSQAETEPKVILVTSSIVGEGKSTCAINLAVILAQSGARTLIVDADLRRSTLSKRLNLASGPGLSNMLAGRGDTSAVQSVPDVPNLDILISGMTPPNPTDLLASKAMRLLLRRWRTEYDFIVLDSAPILPITDSVALNAQADATLLVVRSGMTERPQIERSYRILRLSTEHFVGIVLNGLSISDSSYYGYYGYRKEAYSYGEDKYVNV